MSAETLRKAVDAIRYDQEIEENLGHINTREYATWLAVADWLDEAAEHLEVDLFDDVLTPCGTAVEGTDCTVLGQALAVARAYLGEDA